MPYVKVVKKYDNADPSWFGMLITVDKDALFTRNCLTSFLEKQKIQTRNLFAGNIIRHPCFEHLEKDIDYKVIGNLENTDYVMNNSFWIGVYPGMKDVEL